jgi:hypothetical protein
MTADCLSAALEYREAGLHPIALLPRSKRPAVQWREYQERMPTIDELLAWWNRMPDANVALVMGRGTFALDVDGPDGGAALAAAGVSIDPAWPRSITARGFHLFFAGDVQDRIGLLPHVDVRGAGYVAAPPSIHESGHVYTWARPITGALPGAPAALMELLRRPAVPNGANVGWIALALSGVGEGQRDLTCFRLACYLFSRGLPGDVVEALLLNWAPNCTPPFDPDLVVKTVASASRYSDRDVPRGFAAPQKAGR